MNHTPWQSTYFRRIFKTLLLATSAILLAAMAILYASFYHTSQNYLNDVNQRFMETIDASQKYQSIRSYQNVLNAYTSSSGTLLMRPLQSEPVDQLQAMREIDYFLSQDPCIHSVYFYNRYTGYVYMFGTNLLFSTLDDFFDTEAVQVLREGTAVFKEGIPRTIPTSRYSSSTSRVSTLYLPYSNGNVIVINLSMEQLFGALTNDSTVYLNAPVSYYIFTNEMDFAFSHLAHPQLQNTPPDQIAGLLQKHTTTENISLSVDGAVYQTCVFNSEDSPYQLVAMLKKNDVYSNFSIYMILFILTSAICFVALLVINLKISVHLYHPIGNIAQMLHEDTPPSAADPGSTTDEVAYIQHSIARTATQLEALFDYRAKHLSTNHSEFLKQQLLYNQYTNEAFWEQCAKQDLPCRPGDHFVLLFAHWHQSSLQTTPQDEQRMLCYALSNVLHELLDQKLTVIDIPFDQNGCAFLCSFSQKLSFDAPPSVLQRIQETFWQYFKVQLSFFVSEVLEQPTHFYGSMRKLQEMARYQYFYDESVIWNATDFDIESQDTNLPALPDNASLENALRASDTSAVQLIQPYFESLQNHTPESVQAWINMLASRLITVFKKIQATQPGFPAIDYHDFFTAVAGAAKLSQSKSIVENQLQQVADFLASANAETNNMLAEKILHYLEENFQNYNLSSKSIAQEHHVSVPYLNRLFKQKTGQSVATYIKQLRLSHAQQMLVESNLSVENIARKVGFENTKYFYTLFKNEFGMSPSNYRISHSILDQSENNPPTEI